MVVRKVVSSEIVQIRYALSSRVERQRRRLRVDTEEHLLRIAELAGLEEEFEGSVGGEVDPNAFVVCRGTGGALYAGTTLETLDEGVTEDVGGVFEEGDFATTGTGGVGIRNGDGSGRLASEDRGVAVKVAGDGGEGAGEGKHDGNHGYAILGVTKCGHALADRC